MSGFERILARVGGDALRDYCSSAIEDELKNLKEKMQSCLSSVEKALEVQDAIQKLNVPLSETNVATFDAIQSEYTKFSDDLSAFVQEQKQIQASQPEAERSTSRARTDSVTSSVDGNSASLSSHERVAKLATKIQHRLSKKHSNKTWIGKNITDMATVATILKSFSPEKVQRRELVLVLDHFISAVLLSPMTKPADLEKLESVLRDLEAAPHDLSEFAKSSRTLVHDKLHASHQNGTNGTAAPDTPPASAVDASSRATRNASAASHDRSVKRQRVDHDDIFVKVERQQQDHAAFMAALDSVHEIYVSDLPWGANQSDVESYFGVAGQVVSVRMPTMDDGTTVGVAILRFSSAEGLHAALRMDGYHFQGKTIRVGLPQTN